jgi:hypothetical protein
MERAPCLWRACRINCCTHPHLWGNTITLTRFSTPRSAFHGRQPYDRFAKRALASPRSRFVSRPSRFFHAFLEGNSPTSITNLNADGTAKLPTDYGLGKRRVQQNLDLFRVVDNSTGQVNTTLTNELQAPYLTSTLTRREGWPKWAQHFCRPGCHRDALIQIYEIKPSDYLGKPAFSFLSRRMTAEGGGGGQTSPLSVLRCKACPPYQMAYTWGTWLVVRDDVNDTIAYKTYDPDRPDNPRNLYIVNNCYPWFGSVPRLAPYFGVYGETTYVFTNVTTINHGQTLDGVLAPESHKEYVGVPCPVDTYNDRCAHYHKYTAIRTLPPPTQTTMNPDMQPRCTPCPPGGYHTGGARPP